MPQLVECVANFSEGRRSEIIAEIVNSIARIDQVHILDQESDPDHNRSVVTFVGPPEEISEASFQAIATASRLIDMNKHQGEHPRIGATDVVPFIPIEGISMDECVALAKALGKRVGEELNIPVYLYESAATRPDRENLATIRKGQYEGLKAVIGSDPDRFPDFGPSAMGSAGATVIGARPPLVAFNVYLTTTDVSIADKIARAVRNSSGGLRFVKGLGLFVDGKAQVSMNLTNYAKTPIFRVVETIRREAQRYGVAIESSELIGLIPQQALINSAEWYLQMDGFSPDQVLETRLAQVMESAEVERGATTFLDQIASGDPTPGGGAAAGYSGAMAAGLVAMVARTTVGKRAYADVKDRMGEIIKQADELREGLHLAVSRDVEAFSEVMKAFKLPKETDEQKEYRYQVIQEATIHAAEVPLEVAGLGLDVMKLALEVAQNGNVNAISDAGSAGALAQATIHSAGLNVKINTNGLDDQTTSSRLLSELQTIEQEAKAITTQLHQVLQERGEINI